MKLCMNCGKEFHEETENCDICQTKLTTECGYILDKGQLDEKLEELGHDPDSDDIHQGAMCYAPAP